MLNRIKYLYKDGFFHIFGGSIFARIGSFIVNILVIRMLPKADYGEFVSAQNIYGYFALFIGIGLTSGILQFCAESRMNSEKAAIYHYSKVAGSTVRHPIPANQYKCIFFIYRSSKERHLAGAYGSAAPNSLSGLS